MAGEFCPRCGTARAGAFRFCRSCGFDFEHDVPPPAAAPEQPQTSSSAPRSLGQLTVLSQAQSCLTPTAALIGFVLGAGAWAAVLHVNDTGSLVGAFAAGLVTAWALGTWVQVYFGNKILRGLGERKDQAPRR